jgi:hypothetical protein
LADREPGLALHPAALVNEDGVAAVGKRQAVLAFFMQLRRARQPCRRRPRGSLELVIDAVDEERAQEVVGREVGRAQADDEQRDGDENNARAERQGLLLGSRKL